MTTLPTLYEYYTSGGILRGLSADQSHFTLNNKSITLYSGALHYFRVPRPYWRDRLCKVRAAGLNCVETYVPWNLHEYQPGKFDFGNGGSDFSEFLNLSDFILTAKEEDLLVILRPGPYICAEWDFGGLPSWLLKDNVKVRSSDEKFMKLVARYFKVLLALVHELQFTKGGAVIAFQIENEYGNTKISDTPYLEGLKKLFEDYDVVELLFTSDTPSNGFLGTLRGVLATANFQKRAKEELTLLQEFQPDKPLMVMEYWTGWFDHWFEKHHTRSTEEFEKVLDEILNFGASVNMYMFHGGTNWGFLNGANLSNDRSDNSGYQPDTTSYDYDAPLSEAGDYTEKYFVVQKLLKKHNKIQTRLPSAPELSKKVSYPSVKMTEMVTLSGLIKQSEKISSANLAPMESVQQSYGYLVYRRENIDIAANSILKIEGHVCDTVLVLVNGVLKSKILQSEEDLDGFGYWRCKDACLDLGPDEHEKATVDLIVENYGRVNYGKLDQFNQHKGLWQGNVLINDAILTDWQLIPLDFKKDKISSLRFDIAALNIGPTVYKGILEVEEASDSFVDLREWLKGILIVNGFVLARYLNLGPQRTSFLPGALLKKGRNEILVFEHFTTKNLEVKFVDKPIFETLSSVRE